MQMDTNVLKIAVFIGNWNDGFDGDRKVIEELTGITYFNFIEKVRSEKIKYGDMIKYDNSYWEILLDSHLINKIIEEYDDSFYKKYFQIATKLAKIYDKNLTDNCFIQDLFIKDNLIFSKNLRNNILLNVARISVLKKDSRDVYKYGQDFLQSVLVTNDWKFYVHLIDVLNDLVEVNPRLYIEECSKKFNCQENELLIMMRENNEYNYYNQILNDCFMMSFKMLSMYDEHFIDSVRIMFILCQNNRKNVKYLIDIFSIEQAQTNASLSYMLMMINKFFDIDADLAWYFLIQLFLSTGRRRGIMCYPKYMERAAINYDTNLITKTKKYVTCLSKHINKKPDRIKELVKIFQFIPNSDVFQQLINEIRNNIICLEKNISDELINFFNVYLNEQINSGNRKYRLSSENIELLEKLVTELGQDKKNMDTKLLFRNEQYLLCDDYIDKRESIFKKQIEVIKEIYDTIGFSGIIQFSIEVENKNIIGRCLTKVLKNDVEIMQVINFINDESLQDIVYGYISELKVNNFTEFIRIYQQIHEDLLKAKVLLIGKNTSFTINLLNELSKDSQKLFWKSVETRYIDNDIDFIELKKYIINLLTVNRYEEAFTFLYIRKNLGLPLNCEIVSELLTALMQANEDTNIKQYKIEELINYLQINSVDKESLLKFEWHWLNAKSYLYKPITIIKKISEKPDNFCDLIKMYVSTDKPQDIWFKLYKVLIIWYSSPYYSLEIINEIDKWYMKMKEKLDNDKCLEDANLYFGKSLANISEIDNDFMLNDAMCNILEKEDNYDIRNGYKFVKIHGNEYEGKDCLSDEEKNELSRLYKKQSDLAADKGLLNITQMFLEISKSV